MRHLIYVSLFFSILSCDSSLSKTDTFADSFPVLALKDTMVFAVEMGEGISASFVPADTIALEVFNKHVPTTLRTEIEHILDGGDPVIQKLGRFPLDEQMEALAIDIQAFWYRNQSLLVYDKKAKQIISLFPVAEFYGGDGGQVLKQTWLLSSNNRIKELIVRESEHALRMGENEEEPKDVYEENVSRYVWQQNNFAKQTVSDSTALIQAFPIDWGF